MTRSEIDAQLQKHRAAFDSHDVDALAACHTEQGTFQSPAAGSLTGRKQIAEVYEYWSDAFPDFEFSWGDPIVEGNRVALFWKFAGTASGTFFGDVKPGTRVEFPGAAEYVMSPDGIESANHVFDFTGALVTAGVLKVKPSQ